MRGNGSREVVLRLSLMRSEESTVEKLAFVTSYDKVRGSSQPVLREGQINLDVSKR